MTSCTCAPVCVIHPRHDKHWLILNALAKQLLHHEARRATRVAHISARSSDPSYDRNVEGGESPSSENPLQVESVKRSTSCSCA